MAKQQAPEERHVIAGASAPGTATKTAQAPKGRHPIAEMIQH